MPAQKRLVDELIEAFDLNQRRKFVLKHPSGKSWDLYFKPITRAQRKKAQTYAGSSEALDISTQLLCQVAELESGVKAFQSADAVILQRDFPESVLNELELFLFGLGGDTDMEEAKND